MLRFVKFNGKQSLCGSCPSDHEVDEARTNMAEIVKRFFNNEPIPQYEQNEMYDYQDGSISTEFEVKNPDGSVKRDKHGNIITEEVLNNEVINLIPIHPNQEDIDPFGDNDELAARYSAANEKLGAFQRVEAEKKKALLAKQTSDAIEIAKKNGYELKAQDTSSDNKSQNNTQKANSDS